MGHQYPGRKVKVRVLKSRSGSAVFFLIQSQHKTPTFTVSVYAGSNDWDCSSHINMSVYISTHHSCKSGRLVLDVAHAGYGLLRGSRVGHRGRQIQQRHRKGPIQGRWRRKKRPNIHKNTHPRGRWSCGATQGRQVAGSDRSVSRVVMCQNCECCQCRARWRMQYRVRAVGDHINRLAIRWRNVSIDLLPPGRIPLW